MPDNASNFFLRRAIAIAPGESGYFSTPDTTLDPNLFVETTLKPDVRAWLLNTLHAYLSSYWTKPARWAVAWLAGSGISYQWRGGRGNGDLDVLLGVDWPAFRQDNRGFEGFSDRELSTMLTEQMRAELWPRTAHTRLGSQTYEVTWYINPGVTAASDGIKAINPYAAYDVTRDTWTVRPSHAGAKPRPDWDKRIQAEARVAGQIIDRFNRAQDELAAATDIGATTNAQATAQLAAAQANDLYNDIHLSRRAAFGEFGDGYGDFYNYRWQSHKANGIAAALHTLASEYTAAYERFQIRQHGHVIPTRDRALIDALTWRNT